MPKQPGQPVSFWLKRRRQRQVLFWSGLGLGLMLSVWLSWAGFLSKSGRLYRTWQGQTAQITGFVVGQEDGAVLVGLELIGDEGGGVSGRHVGGGSGSGSSSGGGGGGELFWARLQGVSTLPSEVWPLPQVVDEHGQVVALEQDDSREQISGSGDSSRRDQFGGQVFEDELAQADAWQPWAYKRVDVRLHRPEPMDLTGRLWVDLQLLDGGGWVAEELIAQRIVGPGLAATPEQTQRMKMLAFEAKRIHASK